jgi:outer membrane receptor protein involved in Fe transport
MKKLITLLFLSYSYLSAQTVLTGKVVDDKGAAMPSVMLKAEGASLGAKTDANGQYKITFPNAGSYAIVVSYIGFEKETIQVTLQENQTTEKNITLKSGNKKIKEVKVKGAKSKSTETATLAEQKASTSVVEIMGSQEMSRKGAGDAQAAVVKMAGINKTEGNENGSLFVRGLGDRYNVTMVNGLLLPSDNPELKNASLSLFPSDIINSISVSKTYNSQYLGDFGGAAINIETKEMTNKLTYGVSLGTGFNTEAIANKNYNTGMTMLGLANNPNIPQADNKSFNLPSNWKLDNIRNTPYLNNNYNIYIGSGAKLGAKTSIGFLLNHGYSSNYTYREGVDRNINSQGVAYVDYNYITSGLNIQKTLLGSLFLSNSAGHKLKVNYLYVGNSDNKVTKSTGLHNDVPIDEAILSRGLIEITNNHTIQLLSDIKITSKDKISISGSFNKVLSDQPDRMTLFQTRNSANETRMYNTSAASNNAYWQYIIEDQISVNAKWVKEFGKSKDSLNPNPVFAWETGYSFQDRSRKFENFQYNLKPNPTFAPELGYNPEAYFTAENFKRGVFDMSFFKRRVSNDTNYILPITYNGSFGIHSGFSSLKYTPNEKFTATFGVRADVIQMDIDYATNIRTGKNDFFDVKILPNVLAKYSISDKRNLKFGLSKTYTLPQFRELALFDYVNLSSVSFGNPFLYSSDNYNFDVKYEVFPSKKELISFGYFAKYIANPINRTLVASSSNEFSYANTGDRAIVTGVELEMKKSIAEWLKIKSGNDLTLGANLSLLYSTQDLNAEKMARETNRLLNARFTNSSAPLQGASPLIVNADVSYSHSFGAMRWVNTAVVNYSHDKLMSIGLNSVGNAFEKGYVMLDWVSNFQINKNFGLGASIRNILNPQVVIYQEYGSEGKSLNMTDYYLGRNISFTASYKF